MVMIYVKLPTKPRRSMSELFGRSLVQDLVEHFAVDTGTHYKIDNLDMMEIEKSYFL